MKTKSTDKNSKSKKAEVDSQIQNEEPYMENIKKKYWAEKYAL